METLRNLIPSRTDLAAGTDVVTSLVCYASVETCQGRDRYVRDHDDRETTDARCGGSRGSGGHRQKRRGLAHARENVIAEEVFPDRENHPATPVPGTATLNTQHVTRRKPDGTTVHETEFSCVGPTLRYVDTSGVEQTVECGGRSGLCPTGNGYVSAFPSGRRVCVFHKTPDVKCRVNGSSGCTYSGTCPNVGDTVILARSVADGALTCTTGSWNTCRVTVQYVSPDSNASRTETLTVRMNAPGSTRFTVGQELPVYYSPSLKRIYLEDLNIKSVFGTITTILSLITLYCVADAASFLIKPVCGIRLGLTVVDRVDDALGLDII